MRCDKRNDAAMASFRHPDDKFVRNSVVRPSPPRNEVLRECSFFLLVDFCRNFNLLLSRYLLPMGHQTFAIARVRCRRWWLESEQYEWPQEKAVLGCFESKDGGWSESTTGEDQGGEKRIRFRAGFAFYESLAIFPDLPFIQP